MGKLWNWLSGKKTYIIIVIAVIVNGLASQGYLTDQHVQLINTILGFLGLGTLRAAVKK